MLISFKLKKKIDLDWLFPFVKIIIDQLIIFEIFLNDPTIDPNLFILVIDTHRGKGAGGASIQNLLNKNATKTPKRSLSEFSICVHQ